MINKAHRLRRSFVLLCIFLLLLLATLVTIAQENDQVAEIVVYANEDWFAVIVTDDQPVYLQGVQFKGFTDRVYYLDADFPVLRTNLAQPGDCFVYRVNEAPLPIDCTNTEQVIFKDIDVQDRFWFDALTQLYAYSAFLTDSILSTCPTPPQPCKISFPFSLPQIAPQNAVIISSFDNIGTVEPLTIKTVINQTGIRTWQQSGWTGKNIRVGVLDRQFGDLNTFEGMWDVEVQVMSPGDKLEYSISNFTQGTNVLEVIHAIAPEAELYACRYDDLDRFTECVDWMIEEGVKIINHSAGVPVLQPDGLGPWTAVANRAADIGILWVNAAGNFAQSRYQDVFFDSNQNGFHEFANVVNGNDEVLAFAPIANLSGTVMLTWGGSRGREANAIDLDLWIFDPQTGQDIVPRSLIQQSVQGDFPFEYATFDMSRGFALQIIDRSGGSDRTPFSLMVDYSAITGSTADKSIIATGDSQKVLTVGTVRGSVITPYSSHGPLEGGSNKPDLVAPGEIQLRDGTRFVGTGASASVISGFTALVWEALGDVPQIEVYDFIIKQCTTDDTQISGPDNTYGQGYMRECLPEPTLTPIPTVTPIPVGVTVEPTNTPSPTLTFAPDTPVAVVTFSSINLREGPGTDYEVLGYGYQGEEYAILAQAYGDWYLVKNAEGEEFWVAASVMNVSDDQRERIQQADPKIIPSPPVPPTPIPTPTPPPPPTSVPGAPEIPGSIRETSTPLPPLDNVTLTPVITATPNATGTLAVRRTETIMTITKAPILSLTPHPTTPAVTPPSATFTPTPQSPTPTRTPTRTPLPTPIPPTIGPNACIPSLPQSWVSYTIQPGDTVSGLAASTGSSVEQIAQVNCLPNAGQIFAGQQLFLPRLPPPSPPPPPDSDGDGIVDGADSCPNEAGPASNNGCPEPPPPPAGFSIGTVRGPGTAASGGCSADSWVSGPPDIQGQICISNATVSDCGYNVSGPGYYNLDFGGVGQSHSVTFNSNYGSFSGGSYVCGEEFHGPTVTSTSLIITHTPKPSATFTRTPTPTITPSQTISPTLTSTPTSSASSTLTSTTTFTPTPEFVIIPVTIVTTSGIIIGEGTIRVFADRKVEHPQTARVELELRLDNRYITATPTFTPVALPQTISPPTGALSSTSSLTATRSPVLLTATPLVQIYEESSILVQQLMGASLICLESSFDGCDDLAERDPSDAQLVDIPSERWSWILKPREGTSGMQNVRLQLWTLIQVNDGPEKVNIEWEYPFQIEVIAARQDIDFDVFIRENLGAVTCIGSIIVALVSAGVFVIRRILENWRKREKQALPQAAQPLKKPKVFISYRRKVGWSTARNLKETLERRGAEAFIDVDDINDGRFEQIIKDAIEKADYFVLILALGTLESEWVRKETIYALQKEKKIIPVLDGFNLDEAVIPDELKAIRELNAINLTPEYFDAGIDRLMRFIGLTQTK